LIHFRRLLQEIGGLSGPEASLYTLHSLKATILSWSLQIGVPEDQRLALGHHRVQGAQGLAKRYSRDDVLPALRAQAAVVTAIRSGWLPLTPQARGSRQPQVELPLPYPTEQLTSMPIYISYQINHTPSSTDQLPAASLKGQEDSSDDCSSSSSSDSSVAEQTASRPSHSSSRWISCTDRWLLNSRTGIYHMAMSSADSESSSLCTGCNTLSVCSAKHWSLLSSDPADDPTASVHACTRRGCFPS
jgi:hypothetical protein